MTKSEPLPSNHESHNDESRHVSRGKNIAAVVAISLGTAAATLSPDVYAAASDHIHGIHTYELSDVQLSELNTSARLGYYGMDYFHWVNNEDTRDSVLVGSGAYMDAYGLGQSVIMPSADEKGSEVTLVSGHKKYADSSVYQPDTILVLQNPDNNMFGDDREASVSEMQGFYNDPHTKLVSLEFHEDSPASTRTGVCDVNLTVSGDEIKLAPNDCTVLDDGMTTDELVDNIRGTFFGD